MMMIVSFESFCQISNIMKKMFYHFQDTEGRRYMEYSNIYGAYNILVWFARKYPELYINDDTKETVLHYAAAQVSVLAECISKSMRPQTCKKIMSSQ